MFGRLPNCLAPKVDVAFYAFLLLLVCTSSASATTVLVIITPDGIAVGADSKIITIYFGGESGPQSEPTTKVFVIHDRIAVGTIGLGSEDITTLDNKPLFSYDPDSWLRQIEKKTPKDISVRQLIDIIKSESGSTFSRLDQLIRSGTIKQQEADLQEFTYLVAGFESGVAIVEEIHFEVDWNNRQLVGPTVESIFPYPDARADFGFHVGHGSYAHAISQAVQGETESEGYKSVSAEAGEELSVLRARKNLTLNQASTLLHALLRAQHKNSPKAVGPPYNIVWLCKNGSVQRIDYGD